MLIYTAAAAASAGFCSEAEGKLLYTGEKTENGKKEGGKKKAKMKEKRRKKERNPTEEILLKCRRNSPELHAPKLQKIHQNRGFTGEIVQIRRESFQYTTGELLLNTEGLRRKENKNDTKRKKKRMERDKKRM